MKWIRHKTIYKIKKKYEEAGNQQSTVSCGVPVYSYQSPGEQVGQLKRRGQTQHHSISTRTRSRQEETQSVHQFSDKTLVSSDDNQRAAAQETKHGVLGE